MIVYVDEADMCTLQFEKMSLMFQYNLMYRDLHYTIQHTLCVCVCVCVDLHMYACVCDCTCLYIYICMHRHGCQCLPVVFVTVTSALRRLELITLTVELNWILIWVSSND